MCGIAGYVSNIALAAQADIDKMLDSIAYRGPDDSGTWISDNHTVCLGHRRLSILDLSPEGHQPMCSAEQRYVMVFNGEVYNYADLRKKLLEKGHQFRGHSDTEVMLASIVEWGLEKAVQQFNGMFAFALWDKKNSTLSLVRDRVGIKPLYYGVQNGVLYFASELKAITAHPRFQARLNHKALEYYFYLNYIPAPFSIYEDISKLPAGNMITLSLKDIEKTIVPHAYWDLKTVGQQAVDYDCSEKDAKIQLTTLIKDAVKLRMHADVPLGAFLSGGIDSSLVVALMQDQSKRPVQTFTIGFEEKQYNEAIYAKKVAEHLGTQHTEMYVSPHQAMDVIPKLPYMYDEPFSDSSQIPTFLVSQLARKHVTVSLSGDGGDEMFGGYNRYFMSQRIWKHMRIWPRSLRCLVAYLIRCVPPAYWDSVIHFLQKRFGEKFAVSLPGDKMHKLASVLPASSPTHLYQGLISSWVNPDMLLVHDVKKNFQLDTADYVEGAIQRMMLTDAKYYLPDDMLTKVDRASMAVSLEARVPLLDHRVVEKAWTLPMEMKIRQQKGKYILRQILYDYVPSSLIERPKSGFGIPVGEWLRHPLRDWAENLLDSERLQQQGILQAEPIQKKWKEHLSGVRNWAPQLWAVLMFQSWLQESAL